MGGRLKGKSITQEQLRCAAVPIVVVFCRPEDYPGLYVARLFDGESPTEVMATAGTLEEIRGRFPEGLVRMPRDERDDPVIVETWVTENIARMLWDFYGIGRAKEGGGLKQ